MSPTIGIWHLTSLQYTWLMADMGVGSWGGILSHHHMYPGRVAPNYHYIFQVRMYMYMRVCVCNPPRLGGTKMAAGRWTQGAAGRGWCRVCGCVCGGG